LQAAASALAMRGEMRAQREGARFQYGVAP
jgi:hypothetical protein